MPLTRHPLARPPVATLPLPPRPAQADLQTEKDEKGEVQPSRDREPPRRCDACTADTLQGGANSGPSRAAGTLQRFEAGVGWGQGSGEEGIGRGEGC